MASKKTTKWDRSLNTKLKEQEDSVLPIHKRGQESTTALPAVAKKSYESSKNSTSEKMLKLKVEMRNLAISDAAKSHIRDTLKYIHGEEFEAKERSSYHDKGTNLSGQYWVDRGNLVIEGGINYSTKTQKRLSPEEKVNIYAIAKLEKYGFYTCHCEEALQHTSHDVGAAYEVLMSSYLSLDLPDPNTQVPESVLEERQQELDVIRSIYDNNMCEERIANQLWVVHLDLPYLADVYCEKSKVEVSESERTSAIKRTKEICKFFPKGTCKYGIQCKYSHDVPVTVAKPKYFDLEYEESRTKFDLEIRFPAGCTYPKQAPLVSIYPIRCPMPNTARLRLTDHLQKQAKISAEDETPCLYSLIDFLQMQSNEVLCVVQQRGPVSCIREPYNSLFGNNVEDVSEEFNESGNKIITKQSKSERRLSLVMKKIVREDSELCRQFFIKQNNPKYKQFLAGRRQLPAWSKMEDVLKAVRENQVVVISGETGCGKSTQVPQFLIDDWILNRGDNGRHVEIVCTQPRRLSAIGVAERVAEERIEKIGGCVGYQIRLESCVSSSTRLLFCTTGILLRRLEGDPTLSTVSHIIVDEVHERSEESDFLLVILKKLLPVRPDLRIILMSATLNADLFCLYFDNAPVVEIPGRTFPVEQYFLEDIIEYSGYILEENSQYARYLGKSASAQLESLETDLELADIKTGEMITNIKTPDHNLTIQQLFYRYQDYNKQTCKSLYLMDMEKINLELIETVLTWIVSGNHDHPKTGAILIFLPGLAEIVALHDQLKDHPLFSPKNGQFILVPLHSTLSSEEQAKVFMKVKQGQRKIVMATNIAETSITIDDCVYVIDSGKMKEKRFDSNKNMESLDTVWVSQANAMQRKGRAGRVMEGVCIHLYTKHYYGYHLLAQPVPEIHRVPLEQIILRIKMLPSLVDLSLQSVLEMTLEPPAEENISSAVVRLRNVGALDKEDQLTALGRHLGALPVDVRIGKLMLFGSIFGCLDSALTIAGCLSYKSPFVAPFGKKDQADSKKKEFAAANSDQLTTLRAYNGWRKACAQNIQAGYVFANENFLSHRTLMTLADMKLQFLRLLSSIGFAPEHVRSKKKRFGIDQVLELTGTELNANGDNPHLLISILCAALYPNIVKVLTPEKFYSQSVAGAIPKLPKPEEIRFKTKEDGYVHLHPSSVNYNVSYFSSPYLVYQEKVKTSRVFIRESSMVPILPMVLFCGSTLNVELHTGTFVVSLEDGWIMFSVPNHEIAELLQSIRLELLKLLDEKINNPSLNLLSDPKGKKIISTIVYLVTNS